MEEIEGVDFGEGQDSRFWGDYDYDMYEGKKIETFWFDYMKNTVAKVVASCDSEELETFYFQKQ